MDRITGKSIKNFFYNYIAHGSIFVALFLLVSIYFILTKTFSDTGLKKSDWPVRVNKLLGDKKSGEFLAKDKLGNFVLLEWEKTSPKEKSYSDNIQNVSDLLCLAIMDAQLNFWSKYPEKCPESFKFFLQDGKKIGLETFDHDLVKQRAIALGKQEFCPDLSVADDIVFFVKVRDKRSRELLGAAIFGIGNEYEYGDVFIRDIASKPEVQDRGLGKLLASSIFKIILDLKRIRVRVLSTNETAIKAYYSWDFYKEDNISSKPKEGYIFMGYDIEKSKNLQKVAARFKLVK